MINEAEKGLEDVLSHNDAMRRTQEKEEDLHRQEAYWIEEEQIWSLPSLLLSEILLTFWVVYLAFFCLRFAILTVGRAIQPYLVWYRHR